eukprot:gene46210-62594_t
MTETLAVADEAMRLRRPMLHTVVNVAKIVNMRGNPELRQDVATADMISVDGIGVLWGARLCGLPLRERVAGIDIMINLFGLCAARGYRPYLLGAEREVLQGDAGYSKKSERGQASYYYSQPWFAATGALTIDNRKIEVRGQAWMDREYSSQPLASDQTGWDWFSLHLASGEKLMLFRLRDAARTSPS